MKNASDKLKKLLLEEQSFNLADLYEILLADGTSLHYTSCDIPLKVGSIVYNPMAIEREGTTQTNDISVDEVSFTFTVRPEDKIDSTQTLMQGIVAGRFDNATIHLYRLFSPVPFHFGMDAVDTDYVLDWWIGRLNIESAGGITIEATASSMTELLNTKFPTHLYYPPCLLTLGDASCQVDLEQYKRFGSVVSSTRSEIKTNLDINNGYLQQGCICFTSGPNSGVTRTISSNTGGAITVVMPFYYAPEAGDNFYIIPACDKSMNCCTNRFNNRNHFRGYPFIPVPETAY